MRPLLFVLLVVALAGAKAISPQEIAVARQHCTAQCNGPDKMAVAKCMRACWKKFFDGHKAPEVAPVHVAAVASPVVHKKIVHQPVHAKKEKKIKTVKSAFAERKVPLGHSLGRMGPVSVRTAGSNLVVNGGLLVMLLAAGAFLMA